jgi:thiamine biosynthesis lipoprotein
VLGSNEVRFPAMGSDFHVIVLGGSPELPAAAHARIDELEARWSRFRPDSEISRLNRSGGHPIMVSAETVHAVSASVEAWQSTDGRFDPTVLPALIAAGYDRDFAALEPGTDLHPGPSVRFAAAPGCGGIVIDPLVGAITLPPRVEIDLGGIGKGLAADLVVSELQDAGALGACVNAGGDLRVWGESPGPEGWVVDVEHLPELRIALAGGAVATSSSTKRRWTRNGAPYHHLLDPRQGVPAHAGLIAVTVIAGSASSADALTKAAFVAGVERGGAVIEQAGATGLLVTDAGTVLRLAGVEEFLR